MVCFFLAVKVWSVGIIAHGAVSRLVSSARVSDAGKMEVRSDMSLPALWGSLSGGWVAAFHLLVRQRGSTSLLF